MSTLIDQAIEAFVAAVAPTSGVQAVYEDLETPLTLEQSPAIIVALKGAEGNAFGDDHPARSTLVAQVEVELSVYTTTTRDDAGLAVQSPRAATNAIWESAHRLLMADPTLGGKALRVRWRRSTWRREGADGLHCWATHTYTLSLALSEQTLLPRP
jgi:hypothetical protein